MATDNATDKDLYLFSQPTGLWKRRGALDCFVLLALGVPVLAWPEALTPDELGYHVWHYWAEGPHPELLWDNVRMRVGVDLDYHCAHSGEHPLHRLVLRNRIRAAEIWCEEARWPPDGVSGGDTLWHALAWNGDPQAFKILSPLLYLDNINAQDGAGMTPAAVAVHRGGAGALQRWLFLGADPDIADEHGRTILHHVAQYGDISWFTEVQDMGASDTLRNDRGQTPIDILKERMRHGTATDQEVLRIHWERRWFQKTML